MNPLYEGDNLDQETEEGEGMRWTQESLSKVRAIVMVAVGALVLLAYLVSR